MNLEQYIEQIATTMRMSRKEATAAITRLIDMGLIIEKGTTKSDEKGQSVESE